MGLWPVIIANAGAIADPWYWLGGAAGGVIISGILIRHVVNDKIHADSSYYASREVCEERHTRMDREVVEIKTAVRNLAEAQEKSAERIGGKIDELVKTVLAIESRKN